MVRNKKATLAAALARKNYCAYTIMVHEGMWIAGNLHRYLCDKVQDFVTRPTDKPYEILLLSVPPQHGKSQTITETLPSWYLGKFPDKRVIEVSYNDDFAIKFGRKNRRKIEKFGWIFNIKLSKAADKEFEIENHAGSMISRGIMSGITGNSGDLIIIDDPIKSRLEADSETYRRRLEDEWRDSIKTRTQAGSKIIVIQTRWHEDDLIGHILETEKAVEYINLPCEAEENDPLGRNIGDALAPEIGKGNEWLKEYKAGYKDGMRTWNALFQGRPTSQEGNIIKREWWRYYTELPENLDHEIISVDATFKDNEDSDYVAIQAWGKKRADIYLIDALKRRMDFPATVKAILAFKGKHPNASGIYIEDKANGPAIISVLRKMIPGIIPVQPKGSKVARVNAVSAAIESGNVHLPKGKDFTDDFVEECAAFPNGANDDQVDAGSQALNVLIYKNTYEKEEEEQTSFNIGKKKSSPTGKGERQHVI